MFYVTFLIDIAAWYFHFFQSIILEIVYFVCRNRPEKEIRDAHILITGSAQGLGRLISERLANNCNTLHMVDINDKVNDGTRRELQNERCTIYTYRCDVSDIESVLKLRQAVKENIGDAHIEYLFNNAGMVVGKLFTDTSIKDYSKVISVNLLGVMHVTKVFLDDIIARGGHLIFISSVAGLCGAPYLCDYSVSKHGVTGFIRGLTHDFDFQHLNHVKITGIYPNFINTGMFHGATVKFPKLFPILEPVEVADEIIKATKQEREELVLPRSTNTFLPTITMLKPSVFREFCQVLGNDLMKTFQQTRHYNY